MSTGNELHDYARLSLGSIVLTAAVITVNHFYVLGWGALALGAVLAAISTGSLLWFRNTQSKAAFAAYMAINLWVVLGFGLMKGLWKTTLRLFLVLCTVDFETIMWHHAACVPRNRFDSQLRIGRCLKPGSAPAMVALTMGGVRG